MNLTEKPEIVTVPEQHYLYVERTGPFQETAKPCWDDIHSLLKILPNGVKKIGAMALFKMQPQMVYRAGFVYDSKPTQIPVGVQYVKFEGGKYSKFTLTGSYMNLGLAWGKTMDIVQNTKLPLRENAFYVENYVNDPAATPEAQLISELMVPTK